MYTCFFLKKKKKKKLCVRVSVPAVTALRRKLTASIGFWLLATFSWILIRGFAN